MDNFLQSAAWEKFQQSLVRPTQRLADGTLAITLPMPLGRQFLYLPRGPLVDVTKCDIQTIQIITSRLRISVSSYLPDFIRADWPLLALEVTNCDLQTAGWKKALAPMQPEHTSILDLSADQSELLNKMHPKTRYNIRLAEKHSVTVRQSTAPSDVDIFLRLLASTTERDKFAGHQPSYYQKLVSELAPAAKIFIAELPDHTPAAAGIFLDHGHTRTYLHGASDHTLREHMAPFALHWQAITTAQAAGLKHYDFWGVAPENAPENHPWAGITRFKLGFGGRRESYVGTWELPINPLWYTVERAAKRPARLRH